MAGFAERLNAQTNKDATHQCHGRLRKIDVIEPSCQRCSEHKHERAEKAERSNDGGAVHSLLAQPVITRA